MSKTATRAEARLRARNQLLDLTSRLVVEFPALPAGEVIRTVATEQERALRARHYLDLPGEVETHARAELELAIPRVV